MKHPAGTGPRPVALPHGVRERSTPLRAEGLRFTLVASRFHDGITSRLVRGAAEALTRQGVRPADIEVRRVPGAFELPAACRKVIERGNVEGIVALGCIIRGATPHFDYVASAAASGLADLAATARVPLAFGVLTTDSVAQALERAGPGEDNKGFEAALSVLEMANLFADFDTPDADRR